ncbi:MAG: TolC family protein [Deltaproteobacteria bacterium]|nr:TolC family protein [Deltaproteobacteria bacterium]
MDDTGGPIFGGGRAGATGPGTGGRPFLWLVVLVGAIVLASLPCRAYAGGALTLKLCIDKAIENYPLSGYARANAGVFGSEYKQSRALLLPSISVSSSYGRAYGYDPAVTNGGIASLQAIAQVDIFNPSRWLSTKQMKMSFESARYEQKAMESGLAYTVKNVFVDAVTYGEEIRILQENIDSLGDYLSLTKRLLSSGLVTENDVLRTQIELDNTKAKLKSFDIKLLSQLDTLSSLTGIPMTPHTVLTLEAVPFTVPASSGIDEQMFSNNPALQAVRYEERSQKYNVSAQRAKHLPTLSIEADAGWLAEPQPMAYGQYRGYSYLAMLNLPVFEWGSVSYGVDAARMRLEKVQYNEQLLVNQLKLSYHNALKNLASAVERINLYQKDIELSKQNFEYSEARYTGGGRISSYEVLLDRQLMTTTQMDMATAQADFYKARYKIQFLRGEIYE